MSIIVERIKYLCEENGLSLRKLEKLLGFSTCKISKWNSIMPNVKYLISIAEYFHVSLDYLCGISNTPSVETESPNFTPELFKVIRYLEDKNYTTEQTDIILNHLKILENFKQENL